MHKYSYMYFFILEIFLYMFALFSKHSYSSMKLPIMMIEKLWLYVRAECKHTGQYNGMLEQELISVAGLIFHSVAT